MRLDTKIDNNFNNIIKSNNNSPDFNTRIININNKKVGYCFYESVSSDDKISNFINKSLVNIINNSNIVDNLINNIFNKINNTLYNSKITKVYDYKSIYYYLSSGYTIIFIDGYNTAIAIETKETLDRGIQKVESEITIKGPKDSFTENYNKNIGLIRKRIKDEKLRIKEYKIGTRTKSKVGIIYIDDITDHKRLKSIERKISNINIDAILDVGYIRDFIESNNNECFPITLNTERPDLICAGLLEGKIAIITENSPNALLLPTTLDNFIHCPEDSYQKAKNVTMTRLIRFIAMITTIITPALYIAITTFNQEVIPDPLLMSLAIQRSGVPFPTAIEILILMITFEMLRESDMRLPEVMGTSISIVGALVLGDAAVNAGIVSPIAVIIVAITSITSLLFTDLDIINAFRWWRFIFIIFSSLIGLVGFIVISIIFIFKLSSIESFNVPYLIPYSPLNKSILSEGIITKSHNKLKNRPNYISNNIKRMDD